MADEAYKRAAALASALNSGDESTIRKALGLEAKPLDTPCPCGCGRTWGDFLKDNPEFEKESVDG